MPLFSSLPRIFRSETNVDRTWRNLQPPDGLFQQDETIHLPKDVDVSNNSTESESNNSHSNEEHIPAPPPSEAAATCHSHSDGGDDGDDDDDDDEENARIPSPLVSNKDLSRDVYQLYEWQRKYQMQQCAAYIEQSEDEAFSYTVGEQDEDEQDLENFQFADELPADNNLEFDQTQEQENGGRNNNAESTMSGMARFFPKFRGQTGDASQTVGAMELLQQRENPMTAVDNNSLSDDSPDKDMIATARGDTNMTKFWWLLSFGALCLGFILVLAPYFIYDSTAQSSKRGGSSVVDNVVATTAPSATPVTANAPTMSPSADIFDRPNTKEPAVPLKTVTEYNLHKESNVTVDVLVDRSPNFTSSLYRVTDDAVQVLDICDDTKWTSRAELLYRNSETNDDIGSLTLSFEIATGVDTTFVECQDQFVTKTYYHVFVGLQEENERGPTPAQDSLDKIDFTAIMEFNESKNEIEVLLPKAGAGVVLLVPDASSEATVDFFVLPELGTRRLNEPNEEHIQVRPHVGDDCPAQVTWLPSESSSILSRMTLWNIPKAVVLSGPSHDDTRTVYACVNKKFVSGIGRVVFPHKEQLILKPLSTPSAAPSEMPSQWPSSYPSEYPSEWPSAFPSMYPSEF